MTAPAAAPRLVTGQAAAPGLALGQLVELSERHLVGEGGTPAISLREAIERAIRQIEALMAEAPGEARTILEFQAEFLADPELLEPAHEALAATGDCAGAWRAAIDAQIDSFAGSDDDYFRHRAGDLRDMRERVLAILAGVDLGALALPPGAILLADDLAPSRFLATPWGPDQAIALRGGSPTAHVALLARARRVPMVVGIGDLAARDARSAILDGDAGTLLLEPDARQRAEFAHARAVRATQLAGDAAAARRPAKTAEGEPVDVLLNIGSLDELATLDPAICDGIGLVRTELLFAHGPPDEATQLAFYRRIVEWAAGRPVTIRTLDAGGDKPMPGVTIDGEANPFLGVRGLRLSLARPDLFKVQLRALLRAAVAGNLRVMLPMVTTPDEVARARAVLDAAVQELAAQGVPHARPQFGIMVEVPAAALALDAFDVDFASIGSNDLLQYTAAAARDNPAVTALADPRHPGFVALLQTIVLRAARRGLSLSLCGDLAAQPAHVPLLLACGLRALSMPAASVGAVKRAIGTWSSAPAAEARHG